MLRSDDNAHPPPGDAESRRVLLVALNRYISAVFAAALSVLVCLVALGEWKGIGIDALVDALCGVFSRIDFNNGLYSTIAGLDAAWLFAGILVIALAIRALLHAVVRLLSKERPPPLRAALGDAAVAAVAVVALVQAITMAGVFREEIRPNTKIRSLYYQRIDAKVVRDVDKIRKLLPPRATVRLETDLPYKKRDPAMYIQRSLAFHLYPVDLAGIRREEITHILFYERKRFAERVPEGFEIVGKLSDRTGVAARKGRSGE